HVEEVPGRRLPEPLDVQGRRLAVAPPHDHAFPRPHPVVAGRAVDVVALAPAREQVGREWDGQLLDQPAPRLPRVERRVRVKLAARDELHADAALYTGKTGGRDRKSTRLNSSHEWISYAVFCLTKKKNTQTQAV